jgi:hypothetical protein
MTINGDRSKVLPARRRLLSLAASVPLSPPPIKSSRGQAPNLPAFSPLLCTVSDAVQRLLQPQSSFPSHLHPVSLLRCSLVFSGSRQSLPSMPCSSRRSTQPCCRRRNVCMPSRPNPSTAQHPAAVFPHLAGSCTSYLCSRYCSSCTSTLLTILARHLPPSAPVGARRSHSSELAEVTPALHLLLLNAMRPMTLLTARNHSAVDVDSSSPRRYMAITSPELRQHLLLLDGEPRQRRAFATLPDPLPRAVVFSTRHRLPSSCRHRIFDVTSHHRGQDLLPCVESEARLLSTSLILLYPQTNLF